MLCEMPCLPAEKGYGTARRAAYVVVDSGEDTKVCEGCAADLLIDVALGHVHDFRELVPLPWLKEETGIHAYLEASKEIGFDIPAEYADMEGMALFFGAQDPKRCPDCGAIVMLGIFGPVDPTELAEKQRYHNIVEHGREA